MYFGSEAIIYLAPLELVPASLKRDESFIVARNYFKINILCYQKKVMKTGLFR